jgi:PAS domain S-box-containing protein
MTSNYHNWTKLGAGLWVCLELLAVNSPGAFAPETALVDSGRQDARQYSVRVWQTENGLPQNSVRALRQTRDGYLWAATQEGVARFNGTQFAVFDKRNTDAIQESVIISLAEGADGSLWIGTEGRGLVQMKDGKARHYTMKEGLPGNSINVLHVARDDSLWIGTRSGLGRLKDGRFTTFRKEDGLGGNSVRALAEDAEGQLWIGTRSGLICYNGAFTSYGHEAGLKSDSIDSLFVDDDGSVWLGTGAGLAHFKDGTFKHYSRKNGLAGGSIHAIHRDRAGTLWIGTSDGLSALRDGRLDTETARGGLHRDVVYCFHEDFEGGLWVGTNDGLKRLRRTSMSTFGVAEGLTHNLTTALCEGDHGEIWTGTYGGGLNRFADGQFTAVPHARNTQHAKILALANDRGGGVWIGTEGRGLYYVKDGKSKLYSKKHGLPSSTVRAVMEATDGAVWIGTSDGVSVLRNGVLNPINESNGLQGRKVRALLEDRQGRIWAGTDKGLNRIENGTATTFGKGPGLLSHRDVLALYEDAGGTLWIGTDGGGLNRMQGGRIEAVSGKAGLGTDTIFGILEDDVGHLWLASRQGIIRVSKEELNDYFAGKVPMIRSVIFGKQNGMASAECSSQGGPSALKTKDGRLWFATIKGVTSVDPANLRANDTPPPVVIESVLVNGQPAPATGTLRLPPGEHELEIRYAALSYVAPQLCQFKYRLEGLDANWIHAGGRRVAYYSRVPHGEYQFRVIATNNDGVWNLAGASFGLNVPPYFYQTLWFRALCVPVAGLALLGLYRGRVRHLNERQKELGRLVDDKTRELQREHTLIRTLIDHIPDCIYVKNIEGAYVLNNPAHLRHLGSKSQAETLGRTVCDFLPLEAGKPLQALDLHVIRSGQSMLEQEEHGRDAQGGEYWRLATKIPLHDAAGDVTGMLGISREITERKCAEQALAYERDLFNELLENIPDHVYFKDRESRFIKVSRSVLARRGMHDPAQLLGKTDFDLFTDANARAFLEDDRRIMRTGEPMIGVIEEEQHQNGQATWAMTTKMPWRDNEGRIIGTFGISRDITALKQAESQLQETHQQLLDASRQAGMAEVATGVLHNVGNVLNSVNISATLIADAVRHSNGAGLLRLSALIEEHQTDLARFLTEDARGRQIPAYVSQLATYLATEQASLSYELDGLRKNIEHIKEIVAMQQNYARVSGVRETMDVTELVEDTLRLNAGALTRHEVQVVREYEQVPKVTVERHKVLQILVNLVRNAKYACDESGQPGRMLSVQVQRENGHLQIRVRDNGIGISPENVTRIFNHGFTTRKEGHGFGLHSAALAAKELGGSLFAHSDGPGQGATFTLELPLDSGAAGPRDEVSAEPTNPNSTLP